MALDLSGLVIFLLAVVPGFVAQEVRYSLVPRSLRARGALEETGHYLVDSIFIHILLLLCYRVILSLWFPSVLSSLQGVSLQTSPSWAWEHRLVAGSYLLASLVGGFFWGLGRAVVALNQPIRNRLLNYSFVVKVLQALGVHSFLEEEPVWHEVLKPRDPREVVFLEIRMKNGGGFYTGKLHSYGILDDSQRDKDFCLVEAHYKTSKEAKYEAIKADRLLLNFGDVESVAVAKALPR